MTAAKTPTIVEALADVMADVRAVGKDDFNEHQRFNFRGIDAVVNAVGPVLRKHKVIVVPDVLSTDYSVVATTTGKASTACRVHVAYTFHGPAGDELRTTVIGEAWDHGDKATPKAMSVAFRTALLQALALPTHEADPDAHTYERDAVAEERLALLQQLAEKAEALGIPKASISAAFESKNNGRQIRDAAPAEIRAVIDGLGAEQKAAS